MEPGIGTEAGCGAKDRMSASQKARQGTAGTVAMHPQPFTTPLFWLDADMGTVVKQRQRRIVQHLGTAVRNFSVTTMRLAKPKLPPQ